MIATFNAESPRTLIDELLAEQQSLTAVERFARKHERDALPAQSRYYRDLIPLTKPARGEQYAFAVDLDICTGCKACVSACHSLNGLDEDETWRDIGLIHGGTVEEAYQQTVTTACHHCVEPGCLLGCPVRAYEKDAETGIVRHLDDQCIGCQYCVLKCPYDVPKYSKKRGIVRKCDMCYGRLSVGEAPACVQACPSGAITIRIAQTWEVSEGLKPGDRMLPGAFDSDYTKPTSLYTTRRTIPADARAGDAPAVRPEHAHWPLIWMLLLTQVAAGLYLGAAALAAANVAVFDLAKAPLALAAFAALNVGLFASVFHLGRPLGAWRAFLGLRTSWMSREIVVFGIFAGAAGAFTLAAAAELAGRMLGPFGGEQLCQLLTTLTSASPAALHPVRVLAHVTAALALLGVFCSAMIYIDTHRAFWSRSLVFTKFFGTALLLGTAGTGAVLAWTGVVTGAPLGESARSFAFAAMVVRTVLFAWELNNFRVRTNPAHPNHRSALVMWKLRRPLVIARWVMFGVSTLAAALALTRADAVGATWATLSFLTTSASQVIERYFFFTAVVAYRMPGAPVPEPAAHA